MSAPDLCVRLNFRCKCGRRVVLEEPPLENIADGFDPLNVARLVKHFTDHYAEILGAKHEHERALSGWENEGGP